MRSPDHSTVADLRCRHEKGLGELFTAELALCEEAGLVEVGVNHDRTEAHLLSATPDTHGLQAGCAGRRARIGRSASAVRRNVTDD